MNPYFALAWGTKDIIIKITIHYNSFAKIIKLILKLEFFYRTGIENSKTLSFISFRSKSPISYQKMPFKKS